MALNLACAQHYKIIKLVDLNIHVDNKCTFVKDFLSILDYFDISQHIDFMHSMHTHSHNFDLFCSAGINNVLVLNRKRILLVEG